MTDQLKWIYANVVYYEAYRDSAMPPMHRLEYRNKGEYIDVILGVSFQDCVEKALEGQP